jgi:hypothetical protein
MEEGFMGCYEISEGGTERLDDMNSNFRNRNYKEWRVEQRNHCDSIRARIPNAL